MVFVNVDVFQETAYITGQVNTTEHRTIIFQIILEAETGQMHISGLNFEVMTPTFLNQMNYYGNFINYE